MMRLCSYCGCEKFYDPNPFLNGKKASGFFKARCWDCFLIAQAKIRSTPEGRARRKAANAKFRSTPEGRARHIQTSLAWQKKYPEKCVSIAQKYKARKLRQLPHDWYTNEETRYLTELTISEINALGLTVDHMISLADGGEHVWWNLNALTHSINSKKNRKSIDAPCWLCMQSAGEHPLAYEAYVVENFL